jgi:hypothetical protein
VAYARIGLDWNQELPLASPSRCLCPNAQGTRQPQDSGSRRAHSAAAA